MPVVVYFEDLQAASRSPVTIRSYGMDLLRWWRFLLCTSSSQVKGAWGGDAEPQGDVAAFCAAAILSRRRI